MKLHCLVGVVLSLSDNAISPIVDFPHAVTRPSFLQFSRVSRQLPAVHFRNRHARSNRPGRLVFLGLKPSIVAVVLAGDREWTMRGGTTHLSR